MKVAMLKIATLALDVALRVWMRDKESYIVNSVLDVERFATKAGCDAFQKRNLNTNIQNCITEIGQKLYSAHFLLGIEEERQKVIVEQVASDIKYLDVSGNDFYEKVLGREDITPSIMKKSEKQRALWDEKEKGAYNNCVRFVADAIVKFVTALPVFSVEALKTLYKQNEAIWNQFNKKLDEIYSLLKGTEDTLAEYREFQTDYLRAVESVNGKVELFGSGITRRHIKQYDLSTSYVELCCEDPENEDDYEIELSKVFEKSNVLWIAGEPGGGKTTFLQWIAICAARNKGDIKSVDGLIPIVLKLRDAAFPINYKNEVEKVYNVKCPDGWIEYLFKNDKIILMFDGLDEIKEENRFKIYEEVESICKKWGIGSEKKRSKIVVTARMHVDDELYCEHNSYEIKRMKMPSIVKFVKYWHKAILKDSSESDDEINEKAQNVIDNIGKSQSLKMIAGTPLLCAMICALGYSNGGAIPTDRIEIYAKCSQMLVLNRDVERHISIDDELSKLEYKKWARIIEDIAYYMMITESVTMDKDKIVRHLEAFLKDSTLIASQNLKENPVILVDYLIQRAGIIREPTIGKIDFVHKTFMEYMAAEAIANRQEFEIVSKKAISNFWKETIVMSFGVFGKDIASMLLEELLDLYSKTSNSEYIFMASLCAKSAKDISMLTSNVIDDAVRGIIPPREHSHIQKLAETGEIVVPFLYDNDIYTDEDRKNCLAIIDRLIGHVETSEIVLVVFSYIEGRGNNQIKEIAAKLLFYSSPEWIEEHDIKLKMSRWLRNLAKTCDTLTISDYILGLISAENIKGAFSGIERVKLKLHEGYFNDGCEVNLQIYKEFAKIKALEIYNVISSSQLKILKPIEKLEELTLDVLYDEDILIDRIGKYESTKSIKKLTYVSSDLTFLCNKDFYPFKNLKTIDMTLANHSLEINLNDLEGMNSVKNFNLCISGDAYDSNDREIAKLLSSGRVTVYTA